MKGRDFPPDVRFKLAKEIFIAMASGAGAAMVPAFIAERALEFADAWLEFEDETRFPHLPEPDGTRVPSGGP